MITCLLLATLLGCGGPPAPVRVRYRVVWDRSDTVAEGTARRLVNDLGYAVTLTEARLVEHTQSLVPCKHPISGVWNALMPTAVAAHPAVDDPSSVVSVRRVDALSGDLQVLGETTISPTNYCAAYWLIADPKLTGPHTSVALTGTWTRGEARGSFSWHTAWPQGSAHALPLAEVEGPVAVTVHRRLSTLLNGVDFVRMRDVEALWQVLVHLVEDTTVTLASAP